MENIGIFPLTKMHDLKRKFLDLFFGNGIYFMTQKEKYYKKKKEKGFNNNNIFKYNSKEKYYKCTFINFYY